MKALLNLYHLEIIAETNYEKMTMADWQKNADNHVFQMMIASDYSVILTDLGPAATVIPEPLNISHRVEDQRFHPISNLAHTPFVLHGLEYASVESFWQGLKFPEESQRLAIAPLSGKQAKKAGNAAEPSLTFEFMGKIIATGTFSHWRLMKEACYAKFQQHAEAREALLLTGNRPIQHRMRRDSKNIPGVIMAQIWMQVRYQLQQELG